MTELKEEVAELKAGIRELKQIMIVQHENSFTRQNKANQGIIEMVNQTFEDLKTQMAETKESLRAFLNESESLTNAVDWKVTQIKEDLLDMKQKTDASFAAVQNTLGDLEAEQQKVGDGLGTLRSETAQLTLTVGRNITQIKEELSDGFATINIGNVEMRQLEIKMEIEEIKNETRRPDRIILSYPYTPLSCSEIHEINANSPPGYYQLRAPNGTITTEYCPMECKKCLAIKSTGGWRRLAYLNMTDPTHECPSGFRLFTEPRRCSSKTNFGCSSVTYPVHGIQYQPESVWEGHSLPQRIDMGIQWCLLVI